MASTNLTAHRCSHFPHGQVSLAANPQVRLRPHQSEHARERVNVGESFSKSWYTDQSC